MENEGFKIELKYIYSIVSEMLKFAESKHNGILVFDVGLIIGVFTNYTSPDPVASKVILELALIAFCFSIFMSFVSMVPITKKTFHTKKILKNPNLYFFGDLAELDLNTFISDFSINGRTISPDNMDTDLINQILIISRIAKMKFKIFKVASYSTMFGIGILAGYAIMKALFNLN